MIWGFFCFFLNGLNSYVELQRILGLVLNVELQRILEKTSFHLCFKKNIMLISESYQYSCYLYEVGNRKVFDPVMELGQFGVA